MKSIYRSIDNSMHPKICIHGIGFRAAHGLCAFCPFKNGADAEKFYDSEISNNDPIPCSNPHSWEDGKEYEEGKDYEIRYKDPDRMDSNDASPVASPLSSNDEDELWLELIERIDLACSTHGSYSAAKDEMKSLGFKLSK